MHRRLTTALIAGVIILAAACTAEEKVKVALMTKLEAGSLVGSSEVNAAKMFLEEHDIRNIEIVPFDDGWNPTKTKRAYAEVKSKGFRFLVTSHVSTCAVEIAEEINRDQILTFVTGATTDQLSGRDDYILRNIPDVRQEQRAIARYVEAMPQKRLLVVRDTDNSAYTTPALQYFVAEFKRGPVGIVEVSLAELDLSLLEGRLRREDYDAVYLIIGGYKAVAGTIAQLAKKIRPAARIVYTPWMRTPSLVETAGASLQDSILPSHYPSVSESPQVRDYLRRYKHRFRYSPTLISINVYAAIQILAEAIGAGHRTPEAAKRYILQKGVLMTDFGPVHFDRYGDVQANLHFLTDMAGEF